MSGIYEDGRQPCDKLKRGRSDTICPEIPNVHQCPTCWGRRTWCDNCHMDHHEYGWESCSDESYKPRERCEDCNVDWYRTCERHTGSCLTWPAPKVAP